MKKKGYLALVLSVMCSTVLTLGGSITTFAEEKETTVTQKVEEKAETVLEDGLYTAKFDTDSGMFHVNEANDGLGILTVKDGKMTIHISLASKSIVNLYPGITEDAKKEGAELLEPTIDTVTYSDGWSEEVYGFDIPVPVLDEEFDLALIGKKEKWYDHKVIVSDPQPAAEEDLEKMASTAETEMEE